MHRSLVLVSNHLSPLVPIAQAAEAAGFYRVWTTEGTGGDAIARAQHILANTRTILVGSGIAYAFARPPLTMAVLAADVQEASGGRFTLGVGSGTKGVRERRYGVVFDHPAPRMAEYVELVRTALHARDGLSFHGKFYQIEFPQFVLPHDPALTAGIELYGASLAPTMTRYMAGSGDGVALHSLALFEPYFSDVTVPAIRKGAEKTSKMPRVAAWKIAAASDDEEYARRLARRQLAFYFSTPSYGAVLAGHHWAPVAAAIREEAKRRLYQDWDETGKVIPDDMVDGLTIAGTPAQVRAGVAALENQLAWSGVDEIVLQTVGGDTPEETVANAIGVVDAGKP
jgi:alkanesulfonate monooxygenase SsuD/methylene tetrahydromethanopterin reductase-like flavin-dependent oxidoreductase (luciferase family)